MKLRAAAILCLLVSAWPAAATGPQPAAGTVEAVFTPWDDAEGKLLGLIAGARKSLHVQAYLLTSRSLARALIEAHKRGVRVEVLADREMVVKGENSQVPLLAAAGVPVWLEVRYAAAHNKILLVDAREANGAVATGSYNYTFSAQARNAENLLILRGNEPLARAYLDNWRRHRDEALPFAEGLPP